MPELVTRLSLVALGVALGCTDGERRTEVPAKPPARPTLRLVALTDLAGSLEPCGCTSRPLGGIDRAAAAVARLRADGVPTLLVAAGDLLFGDLPEGAAQASDAAAQELWKAETLAEILSRIGVQAAAPGGRDLRHGLPQWQRISRLSRLLLLPAEPAPGTHKEAVARGELRVGDVAVGVVGVSTWAQQDVELDAGRLARLVAQAQAEVDAVRKQGAKLVVVLASCSQRTGRRLSSALSGVDFVVQGGVDSAEVEPPSSAGSAHVLRAGRNGQGLLVVDVYRGDDATLTDASEWSVAAEQAARRARVAALQARIAEWERDPNADRAAIAEQRQRLDALRARRPTGGPSQALGNRFVARFEELPPDAPSDQTIAALVDDYDARVNTHNAKALAHREPAPAPEGASRYLGAESCRGCHAGAYAWWSSHEHGRAYATLVERHKEFNLSCVGCHVTGYGKPGGSTVTHVAGLQHVGCESCHGAGSRHVKAPDDEPAIGVVRDPPEAVCKACHTPEHSDEFDYPTHREKLIAPGHGAPSAAARPP